MLNQPVFQVSECIEVINHHLGLLGEIVVEGEISRLDIKNGRLIFGTIKDSASSLDIFTLPYLVKNYRQFEPGMLVHVYGTPGLYKGSGKFRFYVSQMVPQGEGSLQVAYEKLKSQLESEGLFAPERKRPLPPWPKNIGLITAPGSSAQADLLKILAARMGNLHLKTLPVNVQGRDAIPTLLRAFSYINKISTCPELAEGLSIDLVIMARGGGSLEDLAAFNSEEICRAVYGCHVPVISAIGHEDNWSLCDFVADVRASTPSNAAELAVRDRTEVANEITLSHQLMHDRLLRALKTCESAVNQFTALVRRRVQNVTAAINQALPLIHARLISDLTLKNQSLKHLERLLTSLDYRVILNRGYSITTIDGQILKSATAAKTGRRIHTQLSQGEFDSVVS